MDKYMTSFGIPITYSVEGGTIEDVRKSASKKLENIKLSNFPSLAKLIKENQTKVG